MKKSIKHRYKWWKYVSSDGESIYIEAGIDYYHAWNSSLNITESQSDWVVFKHRKELYIDMKFKGVKLIPRHAYKISRL